MTCQFDVVGMMAAEDRMADEYSINSLWPSDNIWQSEILVNTGSGNGLLPDSTKPSPEPILTNQWGLVAFTWRQFYRKCSR